MLQNSHKNFFAEFPFLIKLEAGRVKLSEAATGDVLYKKLFWKRRFRTSRSKILYTK